MQKAQTECKETSYICAKLGYDYLNWTNNLISYNFTDRQRNEN